MVTFVASQKVNMNTASDLAVLLDANTYWTTPDIHTAIATSSDTNTIITLTGLFAGNIGEKPSAGTITDFTVSNGVGTVFTVAGLPVVGLSDLIDSISDLGAHSAFAALFSSDDIIVGSGQADTLNGFTGEDTMNGGGAGDTMFGGEGDDNMDGDGGADGLLGGADNDKLRGDGGKDFLNGGAGKDTAYYSEKAAAVVVTLHGSQATGVFVGGRLEDTIKNIERVVGGDGDDTLIGDSANNIFYGNGGNDRLLLGKGGDAARGGDGQD